MKFAAAAASIFLYLFLCCLKLAAPLPLVPLPTDKNTKADRTAFERRDLLVVVVAAAVAVDYSTTFPANHGTIAVEKLASRRRFVMSCQSFPSNPNFRNFPNSPKRLIERQSSCSTLDQQLLRRPRLLLVLPIDDVMNFHVMMNFAAAVSIDSVELALVLALCFRVLEFCLPELAMKQLEPIAVEL
jgi:hypothetical protein